MEVTKWDMRNIRYFARRYACNAAPYEDLIQEGWLAAATVENPTHKYLQALNAIQEYKRKATQHMPSDKMEYLVSVTDKDSVDDADFLEQVLKQASLTAQERYIIDLTLDENFVNLVDTCKTENLVVCTVYKAYGLALIKLQETAARLEKPNASR